MLLGELIGTATGNKSGLMSVEDKKRLGRRFFKGYTKLVESKYWYNHYVALIFGASPASNLGSLIAIDWKGNELISVTRFFGNNDNVKLYLGSNPETNMYELWLGLIGLDGDGSEFIIQSRESIDLDSKTVETLPSYLKVISISWQKNNDFSELGGLIGVATAKKDGLMPMEQFFDRDVNPIEDYNTFTWNGIRKTTKSTSNSPFESGDGQNAVIFIGTNDVQKIGFQATYSGQLIKIRLYWVGSWGKWQTFSLT